MSMKNWSTTAGSNATVDSINFAEGQAPSTVNDSARAMMADVRYELATQDTIASATTTDLGSKDAGSLTISGTTTITSFGTVSAGIRKLLVFSGALTLTHNGTSLILPGAANITTVAGDSCIAESLGSGNWKVHSFQRISNVPAVYGTGVATALAVNVGSAGAPVVNGGALGTPSSGTVTNLTGTASININGTVGATTPTTGAFTTLSASGTITNTKSSGAFLSATGATTGLIYANIANTSGTAIIGVDSSTGGTWTGSAAYSVILGTDQNKSVHIGVNGAVISTHTAAGLLAGTDNTLTLGGASNRWSVVYAGTGTINTSDAREKTHVSPMSAAEVEASKQLAREIGIYKWLSAVEEKGDAARKHVGLTVQKAIEIMQANGLDPMAYGFICYDQWEGGDRYAFRYDELNLFIARGLEARLSALEA